MNVSISDLLHGIGIKLYLNYKEYNYDTFIDE